MKRARWTGAFREIGITRSEMERLSEEEFIEKCAFIRSLDFVEMPAYSDEEEKMLDLAIITSSVEAKNSGSTPEAGNHSDHSDSDSQAPPRPPSAPVPEPEPPRVERKIMLGAVNRDDEMPELEVLRRFGDIAWPNVSPVMEPRWYRGRTSSDSRSLSDEDFSEGDINRQREDNVINRPPSEDRVINRPREDDVINRPREDRVINRPPSEDQLVMRDQDAEYRRALEEAQRREIERVNKAREDDLAMREQEDAQKRERDERDTMKEIAMAMPEPAEGSLLAFTMPNGERIRRRFEPDTMGEFVWLFIAGQPQMQTGEKTAAFVLKWARGQLDRNKTLAEQDIGDRVMLQVILD